MEEQLKILDDWSRPLAIDGAPHQKALAQAAQDLVKHVRTHGEGVPRSIHEATASAFQDVVAERDNLKNNLEEALAERDKALDEVHKLQQQILKLDTDAKAADIKAGVGKLQDKVEKAQEAAAEQPNPASKRKADGDSTR